MITQDEHDLEEVANLQLKAMREVLNKLLEASGVPELPHEFYWFRYADYVEIDRYGSLECWSRGCRGTPDERCSYNLEVDEQLLKDRDVEAYKARFRAEQLPKFNQLRAQSRANLEASIKSSQAKLITLQGDIQ